MQAAGLQFMRSTRNSLSVSENLCNNRLQFIPLKKENRTMNPMNPTELLYCGLCNTAFLATQGYTICPRCGEPLQFSGRTEDKEKR